MPRPSYVLIPGALQRLLDARGVTVKQVADVAGLHERTVRNAARGVYPSAACGTVLGILVAFDARPSELIAMPAMALAESQRTARRRRRTSPATD